MSSAYVMRLHQGQAPVQAVPWKDQPSKPSLPHIMSSLPSSPTRGPDAHRDCFSQHASPSSSHIFTTSKAGTSLASSQTKQKSRGCFSAHTVVLHTRYTGGAGMQKVRRCPATPHHSTAWHPARPSLSTQPPKSAASVPWAHPG